MDATAARTAPSCHFHLEDSQIRLPLVESVQRITIRAEVGRRRLPTNRSIEHAAQRHSIRDAAVHAKADDPSRALVHHDEHPVGVQDADSHRNRSRLQRLSFA
jgi:hypothetical protein